MIKIGNNLSDFSIYSCQPKTVFELKKLIDDRLSNEGISCDLNDIDTSLITNMAYLFYNSNFIGDISKWDVSKVEDMSWMFDKSKFNNDISNWKINSKCDTYNMFAYCPIKDEYKPKSLR